MAPSLFAAISAACSGLEMPKPMATGVSVALRIWATMESRSVVIFERVPVTPSELTQYTKPCASRAIMSMRSSEVGAIMLIRSMPLAANTSANSVFSSKGTSGRISPSMPASAARSAKRSMP